MPYLRPRGRPLSATGWAILVSMVLSVILFGLAALLELSGV